MKYTRHNSKGFWVKGQPLSEHDMLLLQPLLEKAAELGRTPTVVDVHMAARIKTRFRIWRDAVLAAGLPPLSDPEQMRLRKEAKGEAKQ